MMILSGKAKIAGVMGWPVEHSLSPRLHGYWLTRYGIDGAYVPFAVDPNRFGDAMRGLVGLGFAGTNVTVPHKESAFALVDEASEVAIRAGAVNTVIAREDGSLFGTNTDGFGFIENLRDAQPGWSARGGPAVVFGAGGAARAICAAILDAGAPRVRLVNRTRERAEILAKQVGGPIDVIAWDQRDWSLMDATLVVNTTTQGMHGRPPLDINLDRLPQNATVTDIVYTPLITPLLRAAQARGNSIVDGLGMLLHQGRPGFAAWFGVDPEVTTDLRDFVRRGLPGHR